MKKSIFPLLVILSILVSACSKYGTGVNYRIKEDGKVTAYPTEDQSVVLHNPDMGWVLYDNFVISKRESPAYLNCPIYGYDFPGVDNVMLKFTWADIEKEEGVYDFTEVDIIYDYWTSRGKTLSLGMSTDSLLWYGLSGTGVPMYVTEKMPPDKIQVRDYIGNNSLKYKTCDASDPYYQERLSSFLKECDKHFKETNRPMDYIDLRGYGLWGEWHQGYQYKTLETKRQALDDIMRIWSESFPDSWLALSYSYDPDEPNQNYSNAQYYSKYLEWSAFDLAMEYPNITLRRDGAGGAVQNNERIFCENVFNMLERGPFTSEGAGGYENRESAMNIINDGLTLHPNFFTIVGWANAQAKDFIELEPDLFNYGLMQMGYRFAPYFIEYDETIYRGNETIVSSQWVNRAVGRAIRDYDLVAVLTDDDGKKKHEWIIGSTGCSKWIKGSKYDIELSVVVPEWVKRGKYNFCIAMYDQKTQRYIGLPIKTENDSDKEFYKIGPVTVK